MNNPLPPGHQGEMSVGEQLSTLRTKERRNVAGAMAIQVACACVIVAALGGSLSVAAVALVAVGASGLVLLRRLPSIEDLAARLDRSPASFGVVRTALAAEAGRAHGSPLLVAHTIARATDVVRSRGDSVVTPFRLPRGAMVAAALACLVAVPRFVSPLPTAGTADPKDGFTATDLRFDRLVAALTGEDLPFATRRGSDGGGGSPSHAEGGRAGEAAAPESEQKEADLTGKFEVPEKPGEERTPEDANPCPPGAPCKASGMGDVGPASAAGGGSNGQAPAGSTDGQAPGAATATDPDDATGGTSGAAPRTEGMQDAADGAGTTEGQGSGQLQQRTDDAPDNRMEAQRDGVENRQTGGINGSGGTDDSVAERSEIGDAKIAEEQIEGMWQASAEGAVDAIEDGLAGERTSVPWRDLHAWYEAIAVDEVAKESVPVTRRAYVQRYFDALAPREANP